MIWISFAVYVIVSALIILLLRKRSISERILRIVVVTLLPGIGWLLPIHWPRSWIGNSQESFTKYVLRQQEEHHVQRLGIYQNVEKAKELNIIPIEEALLVSERQTRRRVMIDVLKQDSMNYLEVLQKAVSNEDTETSHYAVSAIMEAKRKLVLALQELSVQFEERRDDPEIVTAYAKVLQGYMRSGFLDERTLNKNRHIYLQVLKQYIEVAADKEWAFQEAIKTELQLANYAEAERIGRLYVDTHPDREQAYLSLIEVYYAMRSKDKLHDTLDRLKQSPISLSNQALTMVRFWSEGA